MAEEIDNDPPVAELVEMQTTTLESEVPPPPGFPPFLFPENDGGMDADDICARFGGLASLTLSQISRELSNISHTKEMPEVGVSRPHSLDSSSEVIAAVGYAHLPLPSVDNGVMPELVWMPALPQPTGRAADREVVVSRWRLAREGPFLEERSADSIRSLGPSWWARGAMCDVGQSAPGGSPLIGVERRRFPPRHSTSWRGEPRRLEGQLALGH